MKQTMKLIGNTPIYHLEDTNIYIKLEKFNVGGSIKDRAVLGMLNDAIEKNMITEDTTLIEATSGNTGIALAMLGAALKIPVIIIMPETMSLERRQLVKAYGAQLILTDGKLGMSGAINKQEALLKENKHYLSLKQFENPANIQIHYETTGVEIINQIPDIDIFTCTVGTGGTFSGVAKRLKELNASILAIAGEPAASAVISHQKPGTHTIQGIGAGFIPKNYLSEYSDGIITITNEEANQEAIKFSKETGILIGISSGANIALAKKVAQQYPDKTIVTVAPDGGEKYLSVLDFDN